MIPMCKEEIEAIFDFFDADSVFVCAVFEDELFEVEERPFVVDFLADLDERFPGVLGC